jgi:hypothetical protein
MRSNEWHSWQCFLSRLQLPYPLPLLALPPELPELLALLVLLLALLALLLPLLVLPELVVLPEPTPHSTCPLCRSTATAAAAGDFGRCVLRTASCSSDSTARMSGLP